MFQLLKYNSDSVGKALRTANQNLATVNFHILSLPRLIWA
jgi:hypothetical protein